MSEAFISYSRKDLDFVRKLSESLKQDLKEVWVDLEGLFAGEQWWSRVCSEIDAANAFIFVASKDSATSVPCHRESQHAAQITNASYPLSLTMLQSMLYRSPFAHVIGSTSESLTALTWRLRL
jgi:hypothetical protein